MKKIMIPLTAVLLVAAGCSDSNEPTGPSAPKTIQIDATIGAAATRAKTVGNSMEFTTGDQLTVYAWTGSPSEVPVARVVDGITNTLGSDGQWTSSAQMLWADMVSEHYFLGIYPTRSVKDFTADPFSLTRGDYEACDLLAARSLGGLTATDNRVDLVFDHLMARLTVNMNFRNQWDNPAVSAVTCQAAADCTINYLTGTCTPVGSVPTQLQEVASNSGYAHTFRGIVIPQKGFRTIVITVEGKRYTFTHTEDIRVEQGRNTVVNLIVGRNIIELGSVIINDWEDGQNISDGRAEYVD